MPNGQILVGVDGEKSRKGIIEIQVAYPYILPKPYLPPTPNLPRKSILKIMFPLVKRANLLQILPSKRISYAF